MDTRTGKIYFNGIMDESGVFNEQDIKRLQQNEPAPDHHDLHELQALENRIGKTLTRLTTSEVNSLKHIPEADRPRELAVSRFIQERKRLGGKVTMESLNAYRLGYNQCDKDKKQ